MGSRATFGGATGLVAVYTVLSQCLVYLVLWQMSETQTLRGCQYRTATCIVLCVPADIAVILSDPTGSKLSTVIVFFLVTIAFGIYIVHYTKVAAQREDCTLPSTGSVRNSEAGLVSALRAYRPVANGQAPLSAGLHSLCFAKDFVGFTCALSALQSLVFGSAPFLGANLTDVVLITCGLVASLALAALDMTFTLLFPGVQLDQHISLLLAQCALDIIEMTVAVALNGDLYGKDNEDTLQNHLVLKALFGVGVINLVGRLWTLLETHGEVDEKLGLCVEDDVGVISNRAAAHATQQLQLATATLARNQKKKS
eukprot:SAG31_NODE_224_length_19856_cov_33.632890_7_plen_312_part_00